MSEAAQQWKIGSSPDPSRIGLVLDNYQDGREKEELIARPEFFTGLPADSDEISDHNSLDEIVEWAFAKGAEWQAWIDVKPNPYPTRVEIAEQVRRHCTPSSEAYTRGGDFMIRAVADWIENPPGWVQEAIEEQATRNEPEPKIEGKTEPEPRRFAIRRALEALVKAADPELEFRLVREVHVEPRVLTIHRFMTNAEVLVPEEIKEEGVDPAARASFELTASRAYRFSPSLPKEEN